MRGKLEIGMMRKEKQRVERRVIPPWIHAFVELPHLHWPEIKHMYALPYPFCFFCLHFLSIPLINHLGVIVIRNFTSTEKKRF